MEALEKTRECDEILVGRDEEMKLFGGCIGTIHLEVNLRQVSPCICTMGWESNPGST